MALFQEGKKAREEQGGGEEWTGHRGAKGGTQPPGIDVVVGKPGGLEREGGSEPNPDPPSQKISRAGTPGQTEGRQRIQNLGDDRAIARNPQLSLHTLHKI